MASGYEDWIVYRVTDPGTALARLQLHVQYLMQLQTVGSVAADGVSESQAGIEAALRPDSFHMRELNRLAGVVTGMGVPTMQPTRRVDGGTLTAPNTGLAG